jgi:tRNA A37 methylthiotransferase MiaB
VIFWDSYGRRCAFCQPDLNPRISVPKALIMNGVRANVAAGNRQISLATEDMFVWRTDEAGLPFFVPNRSELLDLYRSIIEYPGVEQITLSHASSGATTSSARPTRPTTS